MDLDTLGPGHESEYIIAEHRVAAAGHAVVDALHILGIDDQDIVASFLLNQLLWLLLHLGRNSLSRLGALLVLQDPLLHISHIHSAISDGGVESIDGLELLLLDDGSCGLVVELHLPVLEASSEELLAVCGLRKLTLAELLLDLRLGLCSHDECKPVR